MSRKDGAFGKGARAVDVSGAICSCLLCSGLSHGKHKELADIAACPVLAAILGQVMHATG